MLLMQMQDGPNKILIWENKNKYVLYQIAILVWTIALMSTISFS
jgi:hypothetical protein